MENKIKGDTEPYVVHGAAADGWMRPKSWIQVFDTTPKMLHLDVEIPGWLQLKFPVSLRASLDKNEIAHLEAHAPGYYVFDVPLTKPGIIELSSSQWLAPPETCKNEQRSLSYRLIQVKSRVGCA
jgi:hypothetical protein